ncbi:MAG: alpha/beta fold hydrolase [Bacteriovoracaceae bacterium]|jgi:hypothetical protein|nr:alpha/beta fold hydrolase [Bacteriovoracaceae bacterium]
MELNKEILNKLGAIPDHLMVGVGRFLRKKNQSSYSVYLKSLEFYQKYLDGDPSDFFLLPEKAPKVTSKNTTDFMTGKMHKFLFDSSYHVKNPMLAGDLSAFTKNRRVPLHLFTHEGLGKRPLVLCLHGFMLGDLDISMKMFSIQNLFKKGVDVALYTLPYHGSRTDHFYNQSLLCPHKLPLSLEGVAQAIEDLHSSILLLNQFGYEKPAVIGASLGAFTGCLYSTRSNLMDSLFLVVPAVNLHPMLAPENSLFNFELTDQMATMSKSLIDFITPENYESQLSPDSMKIVYHKGDKLLDSMNLASFAQKWKIENLVEVTGGHWLYFDQKIRGKTWYSWLNHRGFI